MANPLNNSFEAWSDAGTAGTASGVCTNWTAYSVSGGTSTRETGGQDGDYSLNIGSSSAAPITSIGGLVSDAFALTNNFLTFYKKDEHANVAPRILILDSTGRILKQLSLPANTGSFVKYCIYVGEFKGQDIKVRFEQNTLAAGARYYTLIDLVECSNIPSGYAVESVWVDPLRKMTSNTANNEGETLSPICFASSEKYSPNYLAWLAFNKTNVDGGDCWIANNGTQWLQYEQSISLGTDLCTGGTPSADSEYSGSYPAANAFDGDLATTWSATNTAFPHWIKYDFGAGNEKIVNSYSIVARHDGYQARTPTSFKFQGSNDNSTWIDLDIVTGAVWGASAQKAHFVEFSEGVNTTAYRYYRIYATASNDGSWCQLNEIEMFNNVLSIPTSTVEKFTVVNRNSGNTESIKTFELQGSMNGVVWHTLRAVVNDTNNTSAARRDFTVTSKPRAFRCYRLYIIAKNGSDTYQAVGDLELYGHVNSVCTFDRYRNATAIHTSNTTNISGDAAPVVSASNEYSATYPAYKAFKGASLLDTDCWIHNGAPSGGSPAWLKYDFGTGVTKTIVKYTIVNRPAGTQNSVKDFVLQGSNNDSDWDALDTVSDTNNTAGARRDFVIDSPASYRYYRLYITARNGADAYVAVARLELYENLTPTVVTASGYDGTSTPSKAIDGNIATKWEQDHATSKADSWIKLDLGSSMYAGTLFLQRGANSLGYDISISTDDINWTQKVSAHTQSNAVEFLSINGNARYIKIHNFIGTETYAQFYELLAFEDEYAPEPVTKYGDFSLTSFLAGNIVDDFNLNMELYWRSFSTLFYLANLQEDNFSLLTNLKKNFDDSFSLLSCIKRIERKTDTLIWGIGGNISEGEDIQGFHIFSGMAEVIKVIVSLGNVGEGTTEIDIKKNGVSLFSSPDDRPIIDSSLPDNYATFTFPTGEEPLLTEDDKLSFDVVDCPSGTQAEDLRVEIVIRRLKVFAPTVTKVEIFDGVVKQGYSLPATSQFSARIEFSEEMDTSSNPSVKIKLDDGTLINTTGAWENGNFETSAWRTDEVDLSSYGYQSAVIIVADAVGRNTLAMLDDNCAHEFNLFGTARIRFKGNGVDETEKQFTAVASNIVELNCPSATHMRFSLDNSHWSDWETYDATKTLNITDASLGGNSSEEAKTAYVQFRIGNLPTGVYSATIGYYFSLSTFVVQLNRTFDASQPRRTLIKYWLPSSAKTVPIKYFRIYEGSELAIQEKLTKSFIFSGFRLLLTNIASRQLQISPGELYSAEGKYVDTTPGTYSIYPTNCALLRGMAANNSTGSNYIYAFDGSSSTYWGTANGAVPAWISCVLTSSRIIGRYKMSCRFEFANGRPKTWKFQGSNDNSTWIDLDTQTNHIWAGAELETFDIASPTTEYLYYRLYVSEVSGSDYCQVVELQLFEYGPTPEDTITLNATSQLNSPRYDLIYVDSEGELQILEGEEGVTSPANPFLEDNMGGTNLTEIGYPTPPTLNIVGATPLYYVFVGDGGILTSRCWDARPLFLYSLYTVATVGNSLTIEIEDYSGRVMSYTDTPQVASNTRPTYALKVYTSKWSGAVTSGTPITNGKVYFRLEEI